MAFSFIQRHSSVDGSPNNHTLTQKLDCSVMTEYSECTACFRFIRTNARGTSKLTAVRPDVDSANVNVIIVARHQELSSVAASAH